MYYVESPAISSIIDVMKTTVWGESGFPARFLGRGSTAEWANAQVGQHGVSRFTVRGLAKVTSVMLLVAVGHNLLRWVALTT